jgi:hypothetical protein
MNAGWSMIYDKNACSLGCGAKYAFFMAKRKGNFTGNQRRNEIYRGKSSTNPTESNCTPESVPLFLVSYCGK